MKSGTSQIWEEISPPTLFERLRYFFWTSSQLMDEGFKRSQIITSHLITPNGDAQEASRLVELALYWGENVSGIYHRYCMTPLFTAGHAEMVNLLVKHGAKVDVADRRSVTPLHIASSAEVAEALLAHGANVNAINKWGRTPLHVKVGFRESTDIVKVLLTHAADLNLVDNDGMTALEEAHQNTNIENTCALLAAGAGLNISFANRYGTAALRRELADFLQIPHGPDDEFEILFPHPSEDGQWFTKVAEFLEFLNGPNGRIVAEQIHNTAGLIDGVREAIEHLKVPPLPKSAGKSSFPEQLKEPVVAKLYGTPQKREEESKGKELEPNSQEYVLSYSRTNKMNRHSENRDKVEPTIQQGIEKAGKYRKAP